jgi:hypothetical protein
MTEETGCCSSSWPALSEIAIGKPHVAVCKQLQAGTLRLLFVIPILGCADHQKYVRRGYVCKRTLTIVDVSVYVLF